MVENFPLISVVIPCYNDSEYIQQSVKSALDQDYPHIEIIVVDDGSDSATKKVIKNLSSQITKLVNQENRGVSAARNVGINAASGTYILVLDSDDFFEPEFCSKGRKVLEEEDRIKIVTSYTRRINKHGEGDVIRPRSAGINEFLKYNCAMGSSMFRKSDWESCGGYDEEMTVGFEDWEFYIRMIGIEGQSYVIPEVLFNYRLRKKSKTSEANKRKYELIRYIFKKHKNLYIKHIDEYVDHLLYRLELTEKAEQANLSKVEFRLGQRILTPLRRIRRLFRKT